MADIIHFANALLLDFLDAAHAALRKTLQATFADQWLELGVFKHIGKEYLDRARKMLDSPMRVVDMGRTNEDLFGVEHLWSIVNGNATLFVTKLGNMRRAQVYFEEIAELRHNLSHRRRIHVIKRTELLRFTHNARLLLTAFEADDEARRFDSIAEQLALGGHPWGRELAGHLPPGHTIVDAFVGRPRELKELDGWLGSDAPQVVLWGYGGAGKSAIAFHFARQVQEGGLQPLEAVCWASAKRVELTATGEQSLQPDFTDTRSLSRGLLTTLYGTLDAHEDVGPERLLSELRDNKCLVVIDDFDTVMQNEEVARFLLYDIRSTQSRFLFTSRNRLPGIPTIEIRGFPIDELREFVQSRGRAMDVDIGDALAAIASVTGSFPLFVIDLLRYARMFGMKEALSAWQHRQGDAARSYALRRQLEQLGGASPDALIAVAVANRPLTLMEVANISGTTDEDVHHALTELESWRLIERVSDKQGSAPGFDMNMNTRRLVLKTYTSDEKTARYRTAFHAITGTTMPRAMRHAIDSTMSVAKFYVLRNDIEGAVRHVNAAMTGELKHSAELHGFLGWVCSQADDKRVDDARSAFRRAHELGAKKWDTYLHWAKLEELAADAANRSGHEKTECSAWKEAAQVAIWGVGRCGEVRILCQLASYNRTREGKVLTRMHQFAAAQGAFSEAAKWARRALAAPITRLGESDFGIEHRRPTRPRKSMRRCWTSSSETCAPRSRASRPSVSSSNR
jgi:hypothetical protein